MGISRDSKHKRRNTGGKRKLHRKKRKFELGRPPAMTKLGQHRIHPVRCRGGRIKYRALRLETGNYSWPSEAVTRKTRILGVVYNASNNELVRTNTLVKSCILQIDATPFRQWYEQHYGINLGKAKVKKDTAAAGKDKKEGGLKGSVDKKEAKKPEEAKGQQQAAATTEEPAGEKKKGAKAAAAHKKETGEVTDNTRRKLAERRKGRLPLSQALADQFTAGRLYACVTSRPGQCGRCDGYILEGPELDFYLRKLQKKKGKGGQQ
jgi:small subunit ribosomal protein S8e